GAGGGRSRPGNDARRRPAARSESLRPAGRHAGHERRAYRSPGGRLGQVRGALAAAAFLAAVAAAACLEDRPRPAPPFIRLTINQDSVRSPDTVTGTITVRDDDGIDSVWLSVDTVRRGDEGVLQPTYISTFRFSVPA